jgi:muramoyltetrapeptide carboxypeptidase
MTKPWQPLKAGDKVRIIAPGAGSPVTTEPSTNWADLKKCCDALRQWGLEPIHSDRIFGEHASYYNFANTDAERYADFMDALQSDAAAIWMFRGGYGSDRIIASLLRDRVQPDAPKLFVGYSDVTSLHGYLNAHWQWPTLHALSMRQLGLQQVNDADVEKTRQLVFGETDQIQLNLTPLNAAAKAGKKIQATISGGNLTIMQSTLGTPWETPVAQSILLCEDVGEAPYRIARIFQQLTVNGWFDKLQAVVLGDFIPEEGMELVLAEFAARCPVPVLQYRGIGHGKENQPVPLGTKAVLQLGDEPRLSVAAR